VNPSYQSLLLNVYRRIRRSGALESRLAGAAFEVTYDLYKAWWEAPEVNALLRWVPHGGTVIDVGANVGFFTTRFAHKVGPAGKVLAIEPEGLNLRRLQKRLDRFVSNGIVEILPGVVSDREGIAKLQINPDHPGDHKLAASGVDVDAYTLDGVIERRGWGKVDFVKIDVQGAEAMVLAGAREMLGRYKPALWVEIDDLALREMGSDATSVWGALEGAGYRAYRLRRDPTPHQITLAEVAALCSDGNYADFLFLAR
jgi:FkbM family methyltransferase